MDCFTDVRTVCLNERLRIEYLITPTEDQGKDVIAGLTSADKTLPCSYLYDDTGSQLFEEICQLPEYYLTRTETLILRGNALHIASITGSCELVELGSGSSLKTRLLLDAYEKLNLSLLYSPIDVSSAALTMSARDLLPSYKTLRIRGVVATYEQGLTHLKSPVLPRRMIAMIGSSIGNLTVAECDRFLQQVVDTLRTDDYFLLGVDLHKDKEQLEAAYNDDQGVTAKFNTNVLRHLNSRFSGNFNIKNFQHVAFYNEQCHQIEIYLKSLAVQKVQLDRLGLTVDMKEGESIRTEISRKFVLEQLKQELEAKHLHCVGMWTDPNMWCAVLLTQLQ